jgi:hypothetical protein
MLPPSTCSNTLVCHARHFASRRCSTPVYIFTYSHLFLSRAQQQFVPARGGGGADADAAAAIGDDVALPYNLQDIGVRSPAAICKQRRDCNKTLNFGARPTLVPALLCPNRHAYTQCSFTLAFVFTNVHDTSRCAPRRLTKSFFTLLPRTQ